MAGNACIKGWNVVGNEKEVFARERRWRKGGGKKGVPKKRDQNMYTGWGKKNKKKTHKRGARILYRVK